jgi:hypothetical protein
MKFRLGIQGNTEQYNLQLILMDSLVQSVRCNILSQDQVEQQEALLQPVHTFEFELVEHTDFVELQALRLAVALVDAS